MQLKARLRQLRRDLIQVPLMFINMCRIKRIYPGTRIFTYKALIKSIEKRSNTCHVIATGLSALDAYKAGVIKPDEYIIGFNFAAFLPYTFDIYFFEERFSSDPRFVNRTIGITDLLNKRKEYMPNLVFKNARFILPKRMVKLIPDIKFSAVYDRQFVYPAVKKLFARPSVIMPQYCSSVITAIMLAYHAGFTNIVVHGLDLSGPHIYHDEELQKLAGVAPPSPCTPPSEPHVTAKGQKQIWPEMVKKFSEKNVNLYCASPNSNFRHYAPVWQPSCDNT